MSITIAVTGGPSGGKTTLLQILQKDFGHKMALVPEAASILYRGGFPRTKSDKNRRHVQRAICYVQRELEDLSQAEAGTDLIVCDRGSLDSIAYWPASEEDFFESLESTREQEFERYDWVIHLDTAAEADFDHTNPIRTESFSEALALNDKIHSAWRGHPQRLVIPNSSQFLDKMAKARKAIELIALGESLVAIQTHLFPHSEDQSG